MNEYLFIGGTHDGERLRVRTTPIVRLPVIEPERVTNTFADDCFGRSPTDRYEIETYIREKVAGNSRLFYIYVLEGMSADDVMAHLIDGYRNSLLRLAGE